MKWHHHGAGWNKQTINTFLPEYILCGNSVKQHSRCQKCKSVQKAIWQTHGRDIHWDFSKQKYLWLQKSLDSLLRAGRIERKKRRISLYLTSLPCSQTFCVVSCHFLLSKSIQLRDPWSGSVCSSYFLVYYAAPQNQVSVLFTHLI